jgi:solute carrier family 25 aspartate/glutamate transporter 12/13
MATVTEAIKEKVLGTELEPQLSAQTRNNFLQYAKKDEGSDEYYMTETEFVDAIAPEGEDYVSECRLLSRSTLSACQHDLPAAH